MSWEIDLSVALNRAVDRSASWLRVLDFKVLAEELSPKALAWIETHPTPRDLVKFLKKLSFDVCVLPVEIPEELKLCGGFEVKEAKALVSLLKDNLSLHRLAPVLYSKTLEPEHFAALVYLSVFISGYRGPLFLAGNQIDPELGILNIASTLAASHEGAPREKSLGFISPGLTS